MNTDFMRIEVTNRCNLLCSFCYAKANMRVNQESEISTNKIKELIISFSKKGGKGILFTGGECFLRDDIFQLLEHAKKQQLQVLVITNGTLINERNIHQLKDCIDHIYISLDGNEKYHDERRGVSGTFQKVCNTLKLLSLYSIKFTIETIVSNESDWSMDWMDDLIKKYNIENIILCPEYKENTILLNNYEKAKLKLFCEKKAEEYYYRVKFYCNLHEKNEVFFYSDGISKFVSPWVLADGRIMPFLTYDDRLCIGSVSDYINDNLNEDKMLMARHIIKEAHNLALNKTLFDFQETIGDAISNFCLGEGNYEKKIKH